MDPLPAYMAEATSWRRRTQDDRDGGARPPAAMPGDSVDCELNGQACSITRVRPDSPDEDDDRGKGQHGGHQTCSSPHWGPGDGTGLASPHASLAGPAGLLGGPGGHAPGQAHPWLRDWGTAPQPGEETSAELPPECCAICRQCDQFI